MNKYMELAIKEAREGIELGDGGPFGCVIVKDGKVVGNIENKKAKILKDFNGNMWLIFCTGAPSISYNSQWGNNMMEMSFQWGEIGDPNNVQDMQNVGLWPIIQY